MKKNIFYDIILIIFYSCFPVIYLFSFNLEKYLSRQYEFINVLTTCLFSSVIFLVVYIITGIITKKHVRFITILFVFFFYSFGDSYNVLENLVTFYIKKQYFLVLYIFFSSCFFYLIFLNVFQVSFFLFV